MSRFAPSIALLALTLAVPGGIAAQEFGQWWWEGSLAASGRTLENQVTEGSSSSTGRSEETNLELSLALNGYLLHPAFGRFRLAVDALLTDVAGDTTFDSQRTGFDGNLDLFPRGAYPVNLFVRRQLYDYGNLAQENPLTLFGAPETLSTYGGRAHFKRGILRGLLVGFEHTDVEFQVQEAEPEIQDRQFADWSTSGKRVRHHVRLERYTHSFGTVNFENDDLTLNFDERGEVFGDWRWDLLGTGIRRSLRFADGPQVGIDTFQVRNTLSRVVRGDDWLTLSYTGGLARSDNAGSTQSHGITGRYVWRRPKGWQVAPFAGFGIQQGETFDLTSPQLGVSATWNRTAGTLDLSATESAGFLGIQRDGDVSSSETLLALGFDGRAGHGREEKLRKEVEISYQRNQLRMAGEALLELPDLGAPLASPGTENQARGRLTLRRRWGRLLASGYGEWSRRESSRELQLPGIDDFTVDDLLYSFQLSGSRFSLLANLGDTEVTRSSADPQTIESRSLSVAYRPLRSLSLRTSYRIDERRVELGPDFDSERYEAGFDLRFGAFLLEAHAFETQEQFLVGMERTNRGVRWSLSRRFAGWLPVVTGLKRRGVIR